RWGVSGNEDTVTSRKTRFGDAYLTRLGVGDRAYTKKGTDFSAARTTEDWEEVRLKKQLKDLEEKIDRVESAAKERSSGRRDKSKPALVKRELEQLLDYKRRQLRDLETGEGRAKEGQSLKSVEEDIGIVREQIEGLEQHLRSRQDVLADLRRQIDAEKAR
ncbi:endocytosis defective- protein, partial [Coniosporium uncinatum]